MYIPNYKDSRALIIGINKYQNVSPLSYAKNDAKAVFECIKSKFGFPEKNITFLIDDSATREAIFDSYLKFAHDSIDPNDKIFIFFAGHGYTHTGKRGEVGYLVPVNGTPDNLSTLVRWDDLTRNADLIPAKHIFFIMDACYGGLALTRTPGPGSTRFLKNMLQRYTRQVLTAGKADEVVADSGGPIPEHSVFTGHLLQGLEGKAASKDGIICANGLMAYVYDKVSKDHFSQQTPHFGFFDGDGDFIFKAPMLESLLNSAEKDKDILIEATALESYRTDDDSQKDLADRVKEYISDSKYRIKLDDLVTREIKQLLIKSSEDLNPVSTTAVTSEEFSKRLSHYESISKNIQVIAILLSHWGVEEHKPILKKLISRMTDNKMASGGKVARLGLRQYPSILLLYSGGIAAISANKYENLRILFNTETVPDYSGDRSKKTIEIVVKALLDLQRTDIFKTLPGYERYYVPKNEYLFKALQSSVDDLMFLGNSYEVLFDRLEIFLALVYADLKFDDRGDLWGPPGRFAYKHRDRLEGESPFMELVNEANNKGSNWAPLMAGFFSGSLERFNTISTEYVKLLSELNWF